jgi:hypothetical protein
MDGPRRSGRKRTQTQFQAATETVARDAGKTQAGQGRARRARAAAIAASYEPLGGLVQLGEAGGGEGCVWVGADGSPALCGTFHGRLGAGVTISIDAVPGVFRTGLITQHPICYNLFSQGRGVQGNSHATTTAAAHAATSAKAVQEVYERFETACDDLDSGLCGLDEHCYCCMQFFVTARERHYRKQSGHVWCLACSYQVHGKGSNGGQHKEFATTERPNDRCSGCPGCSA